jgi:DNA-binding HxlR family transcriptional regulator
MENMTTETQPLVCDNQQGCPVKEVLRFLAGAWTPEIFYHLGQGPRRFGELQRALGASPKMLTTRLRELEEFGIVHREVIPSKPPAVRYQLTDFGREFQPILIEIVKVGERLLKKK